MSKEYFILNNGRVIYCPGHYELADAQKIAEDAARRNPGRTFTVVKLCSRYQIKKAKR